MRRDYRWVLIDYTLRPLRPPGKSFSSAKLQSRHKPSSGTEVSGNRWKDWVRGGGGVGRGKFSHLAAAAPELIRISPLTIISCF